MGSSLRKKKNVILFAWGKDEELTSPHFLACIKLSLLSSKIMQSSLSPYYQYNCKNKNKKKQDGVGHVDNRPSPN